MNKVEHLFQKRVSTLVILIFILTNCAMPFFSYPSTDNGNFLEDDQRESQTPVDHGTRGTIVINTGHIHPNAASNSDDNSLDYTELDEDYPGDSVEESSGDGGGVDWIQVGFPSAGIPSYAILINITYSYGYYTDSGWELTTDTTSNITWNVDSTQNNLENYTLTGSNTNIDFVQTTNFPSIANLNSGDFSVRFRGVDNGGGPRNFHLDYCYFTVNYSIINVTINEIMTDRAGGPYNTDWGFRKKISIDHTKVEDDLADFPVLISFTDSDLSSRAQPDGDDILFLASDCETRLDSEITLYNATSGQLLVWVKLPLLSSTQDTIIYMYYGNPEASIQSNPTGVWSNDYRGVWHLDEESGNAFDSTIYDSFGIPEGATVQGIAGQVGGAYEFDGTDGEVNIADPADGHLDFGMESFTVSVWVNIYTDETHYQNIVYKGSRSSSQAGYVIVQRSDGRQAYASIGDGSSRIENQHFIGNKTWKYCVLVADRDTNRLRAYLNGVQHSEDDNSDISSLGSVDSTRPLEIGDDGDTLNGAVDEVRVSYGMRSEAWIRTEFNNQYSPASFYEVGVEEDTSSLSSPGYEWVELFNDEASSIDLSGWYLRDHQGITFDLSGAGSIPAGGYLVCHLGESGINSSTDVYGQVYESVIQPDETEGIDNYLDDTAPMINFDAATYLWIENDTNERRPMMQFDLSDLPIGRIGEARVWLYRYDGDPTNSAIVNVHRVTQSWTQTGSEWDTYDGTNDWPIANDGGDYDATKEDTTTIFGGSMSWYSWNVTDLVRGWISGAYPNDGMIFTADSNGAYQYFYSSDYLGVPSLRPKLVVEMDPPLMLDYTDGLYLHDKDDRVVDYIAWGGNPETGDDPASSVGKWNPDDYIDTSSIGEEESFGRDMYSTDSDFSTDWEGPETHKADPFGVHAGEITPGSVNMNQFIIINEVMFDPSGNPYDSAWDHKKKLTIHAGKVAGDLSDFPVVLDMTLWDLATYAQPDGDDILFVGADGETKLAHEIETFNSTTGRLVVWIKIPFLSSSDDTVLYMYFGNSASENQQQPHEVWTNGFVGVYHLNEDNEPYSNSVSYFNYGTRWNTPTRTGGKLGFGQEFSGNGEDDMISLGDFDLCDGSNELITVSAWAHSHDASTEDGGKIISKRNDPDDDYVYQLCFDWSPPDREILWDFNGDSTSYQEVAKSTWVYLTATYDGSEKILYINGSEMTEDTASSGPIESSNTSVTIGANDSPGSNFGGTLDEVRISDVVRSMEWVATEWYNQLAPSAFFSIGDSNNRKPLTLNSSQVTGDLWDFPVFINIIDPDLSANARGDGYDINFKDLDGTRLHHEIVNYDGNTGELKAYVRIPYLSSSVDTTIYMYYNNPLAGDHSNAKRVYDDDFRGVWHLNELPRENYDNALRDSSSYMNHLESTGAMDYTNQVNGLIDGALFFDGSNDYLYRDNYCAESLDAGFSDITIEAWVQLSSSPADSYPTIVGKGGTGPNTAGYWFFDYNSNDDVRMYFGSGDGSDRVHADSKQNIEDDVWHHMVVSVDRDGPVIFYIDGRFDNVHFGSSKEFDDISNPTRDFLISDGSDPWDGLIDEVRISFTVRSSDWINTTYKNMMNPSLFCSVGSEEVMKNWFDTDWSLRKNITINSSKVSGGAADFPILVKITDSDLASDARADGNDIIFVQGQVRLDHEIESFNSGTGELLAWVKVPWLSPTEDKVIGMYYGNAAQGTPTEHSYGVWSNGYVGVYHMVEDTGSIENSVSLLNYGSRGDTPTRISGHIGYGQEFTGSTADDRFILGDLGLTDGRHSELTLSFWLNIDDAALDDWGRIIVKRDDTDSNTLWGAYMDDDGSDKDLSFNAGGDTGAYTIGKSLWVYASYTYDGTIKIHYHNGTFVRDDTGGSGPLSSTVSSAPVTIGARIGGGQNFAGILDEIRISKVVRSADWIATEYNNQWDTPAFLFVNNEENAPAPSGTPAIPSNYEWVELYNPSSFDCPLNDLYLSDYDGNLFDLSGAGSLAAGEYLIAHIGESGTNSSNDVYGSVINYIAPARSMLDNADSLSVKTSEGYIFDYVAWGTAPITDDYYPVNQGIWTQGEFVDTLGIMENETIGRDKNSQDLDEPFDWEDPEGLADAFGIHAKGITPGGINLDQLVVINEIMFKNMTNNNWFYRKKITINASQVASDLTNFPILVSITDSDLAEKAQVDGGDIKFTASDGITPLNHEIERYDSQTGELLAWVNVTSVSGTLDTEIYMYYGNPDAVDQWNPQGVWDNAYVGIWHLSESARTHYDSTANDFDATTYGHVSQYVDGQIGTGSDFNGSFDNSINVPDDPALEPASITLECWWSTDILLPSDDDFLSAISKADGGWADGYMMGLYRNDGSAFNGFMFFSDFGDWNPVQWDISNVAIGSWYYAAGTYSSTSDVATLLINGSQVDSVPGAGAIVGTSDDLNFGTHDWDEWDGRLDEIRLSNIVRSDAWLSTSYNSQHNTDTFIIVGAEESTGVSPDYEWVELYNAGSTAVNVSGWYITDNDGNRFYISDAGEIPPDRYLVAHIAESGISSSTDVYGPIISEDTVVSLVRESGPGNFRDATVDIDSPNENTGHNDWMEIMDWDSATSVLNGLFQFDVSKISANDIVDASLWLYRYDGGTTMSANISACRMTQQWDESTVTWSTYDGINPWYLPDGDFDPDIYDYVDVLPGVSGWYKWDITDLVDAWVDGTYPNYGLVLMGNDEADWTVFRTSDYDITAFRPKVVINYTVSSQKRIAMLDESDDLSLYDAEGTVVDYVAWGEDPGLDGDAAASWRQWITGDYTDSSLLSVGQTLGRDKDSNDLDLPFDWEDAVGFSDPFGKDRSNPFGPSPGARNIDTPSGNPIISDVASNPLTQIVGGLVNITCNVTDGDGLSGVWVNITLPGGGYLNTSMSSGAGDSRFHDTSYSTLGLYQYTIFACDLLGNWSEAGGFGFWIINNAPVLSAGQVNPASGYLNSWFNFTVTYTDSDNHAAGLMRLNISGMGSFDMFEMDPLDSVYDDGKSYYYNTTGFALGIYSFNFAANDTIGYWTESGVSSFDVVNRVPVLSGDQVTPAIGYNDEFFNFTVIYTDLDDQQPDDITLNISGMGIYGLSEVDPSDSIYSDGKSYYCNLTGFTIGTYLFHFGANDTIGDWIESASLQVDVVNRGPILTGDQVVPNPGYLDDFFNFTLTYRDLDDNPPASITVNITGMGNYDLVQLDPLDITYSDGKLYYYNLTGFSIGTYPFHFAANDTNGNWTETGGSSLDVVNRPPQLSGGQLVPPVGQTGTWFNFSVLYTDLDDHVPLNITVNITNFGILDLTEFDPTDLNYADGKLYYFNTTGFSNGTTYSYHFAARDSYGDWFETVEQPGPQISSTQSELLSPQVDPLIGPTYTSFTFTVMYRDLDDEPPADITMNLTGPVSGVYSLSEVDVLDTDYTDGKWYNITISSLDVGMYLFNFAAEDSIGDWIETGILSFDVLNTIPSLSNEDVTPAAGNGETWFNFSVTYTDLDDHAPGNISVNITSLGYYDMVAYDSTDLDYTDGNGYYLNLTGFPVGQYTLHFAARDILGEWNETGSLGFDVLNQAPSLSLGQVDPSVGYLDSWFNFTVIYTDLDDHPPDIITVNITNFGTFSLIQTNYSDMDYSDGKEYYFNISGLSVGLYSFHFAANDSLGLWGAVTPDVSSPAVIPKQGYLYASDYSSEYGDIIYLNATLLDEDSNPISDESVAFYLDTNMNGNYEVTEFVGTQTTLGDGSVSLIFGTNLIPGEYNFSANYTGSANFIVDYDAAFLLIAQKPAFLTAISEVANADGTVILNATMIDDDGNPIPNEDVDFFIDKMKNGVYEALDYEGSTTTSSAGYASLPYIVDVSPNSYGILAKYRGSGNYSVTEVEGLLTVQDPGNVPPVIVQEVPGQTKPEDSQPWSLYLSSYGFDAEDSPSDLLWYLTGVDTTLYTVAGMNSSNNILTFIPEPDAFGSDETILWLEDSSGERTSQVLWINITPVNDPPYFAPLPPNLMVHYEDSTIDDSVSNTWDYTYYVHDLETRTENLVITTSQPTVDLGEGYAQVNGLKVSYHYPKSMLGKSILVTLTASDGQDTAKTTIYVNVTSDWVPELVRQLPDIIIEENSTLTNVFDLDDYFTDRDHDSLYFTSGQDNLKVEITENNSVNIIALGHWTGKENLTFRAEDPMGAIAEDMIMVTVIPVNDAPKISGAPDLVVHFDYPYVFDLSPYISDPDHGVSELTIWTSESTDYITVHQNNNLGLVLNYPQSLNGRTIPVTIYVSDGLEYSQQTINVSVTDDFPPELISNLPDVYFNEDTDLINAFTLSDYFFDIDGDLLFYTNGSVFINITIRENLTVDFSAPANWHGAELVTFRATDPLGALAEDQVLVVVVPVNDAPTIDIIPKQEKEKGDQWILDLSEYIADVDDDTSELTITIESESGQGYVMLVGNILIFQYPEDIQEDIVRVTVSDGELTDSRSFIVSITSDERVTPTLWDMIPWTWVFSFLVFAIGGAFVFYRKRSSYKVYEAFLIHEKGLPIAHASHDKSSELEDVVVTGMFTAVQDFISDTFSGKTEDDDWELDEMKFGENKILIERSGHLYLAVIFEGNGEKLRTRVKKFLHGVNEEYGEVLEGWTGDMTKLKGIKALTMSLITTKGSKPTVSEVVMVEPETRFSSEQYDTPYLSRDELVDVSEIDPQSEFLGENLQTTVVQTYDGVINEEHDNPFKEMKDIKPKKLSEMSADELNRELDKIVGELEMADEYICPVCGTNLKGTDSKCPTCSTEFGNMDGMFGGYDNRILDCPSCGSDVLENASHCPNCNVRFTGYEEPEFFECPECGTILEHALPSCPNCGVKFVFE